MDRKFFIILIMFFLEVSVFRCTGDNTTTELTTDESSTEETVTITTQQNSQSEPEFFVITYDDGETALLSSGLDLGSELVIPGIIDGFTIVSIGPRAFYYNYNLVSVTLPNTIEVISFAAFNNCINLIDINLPDGLRVIGSSAFGNCSSLESIFIPASVEYIDESAFMNCTGITFYVELSTPPEEGWGDNWHNGNEIIWGSTIDDIQ